MTWTERKPMPNALDRFFGFRSASQAATILYVPAYESPTPGPDPVSDETPPDGFLAFFPAHNIGVAVASLDGEWTNQPIQLPG